MKGKHMKKFVAIVASCVLLASYSALAEPSAADQKWLTAVQKMAENGQTKISTPSPERLKLVKDWATQQGYQAEVTKTDTGFSVELQKHLAKN
jgi:hypothetical protein